MRGFFPRAALLVFAVTVAWLGPTGCAKKPAAAVEQPGGSTPVTTPTTPPPQPPSGEDPTAWMSKIGDVFFDYDKYELRGDARSTLSENARYLKEHSVAAVLEGHCDERGTDEYNLALGQRRAEAVKGYLVDLGVSGGSLSTVSYGEERPFASGHDETAWSKNRRAHFLLK